MRGALGKAPRRVFESLQPDEARLARLVERAEAAQRRPHEPVDLLFAQALELRESAVLRRLVPEVQLARQRRLGAVEDLERVDLAWAQRGPEAGVELTRRGRAPRRELGRLMRLMRLLGLLGPLEQLCDGGVEARIEARVQLVAAGRLVRGPAAQAGPRRVALTGGATPTALKEWWATWRDQQQRRLVVQGGWVEHGWWQRRQGHRSSTGGCRWSGYPLRVAF